jgi:hypothetical protein
MAAAYHAGDVELVERVREQIWLRYDVAARARISATTALFASA